MTECGLEGKATNEGSVMRVLVPNKYKPEGDFHLRGIYLHMKLELA